MFVRLLAAWFGDWIGSRLIWSRVWVWLWITLRPAYWLRLSFMIAVDFRFTSWRVFASRSRPGSRLTLSMESFFAPATTWSFPTISWFLRILRTVPS